MPRSVEVEDAARTSEKKGALEGMTAEDNGERGGRRRRKTMVRENSGARGFLSMAPASYYQRPDSASTSPITVRKKIVVCGGVYIFLRS